jgi:nicotinate (nicotinamide) nucleotide adenylyltransferase
MQDAPHEVVSIVFTFLNPAPDEITRLSLVCKNWYDLLQHDKYDTDALYKVLYIFQFHPSARHEVHNFTVQRTKQMADLTWRELFFQKHEIDKEWLSEPKRSRTFEGHSDGVLSCRIFYHNYKHYLMSSGVDNRVFQWDMVTTKWIQMLYSKYVENGETSIGTDLYYTIIGGEHPMIMLCGTHTLEVDKKIIIDFFDLKTGVLLRKCVLTEAGKPIVTLNGYFVTGGRYFVALSHTRLYCWDMADYLRTISLSQEIDVIELPMIADFDSTFITTVKPVEVRYEQVHKRDDLALICITIQGCRVYYIKNGVQLSASWEELYTSIHDTIWLSKSRFAIVNVSYANYTTYTEVEICKDEIRVHQFLRDATPRHSRQINQVVISEDARTIVTGSSDRKIVTSRLAGNLWEIDPTSGHHEGSVTCLYMDTTKIITGSVDCSTRIFDLNCEMYSRLDGPMNKISSISCIDDALVISSFDGTICMYDFVDKQATKSGKLCYDQTTPLDKVLEQSLWDQNREQVVLVLTGAFSPIHIMHVRLLRFAMEFMETKNFQVIAGYISPAHDSYSKHGLLPAYERVAMCELAVQNEPNMMIDKWECTHDQFQLQYEVLEHIQLVLLQQYGKMVRVMYVCGSDLLVRMTMHQILNDFGVVGAERPGSSE